jgi:GNAT superfamily N-acetyltransferase
VRGFACGQPLLDRWIQNSARTAVAAGTAAVYVTAVERRVVGYYALAMASVAQGQAPSSLGRGMPNPVPVVLLARLALDRSWQGHGNGGRLLVDALKRCVQGGREFGARAVVVDAIDDSAILFYAHFGFRHLDRRRLWRKLSDIEASIRISTTR